MTTEGTDGPFVGRSVRRREDPALLTGRAEFTDDVTEPGMCHLALHRSRHAHARIRGIDTAAAEAADGVVGVYTWADVEGSEASGVLQIATDQLDVDVPGHPILARERVRYHGQPIAAVVATDRYAAAEAASAIDVDYDRLEAVTDPVEAHAEDAPRLYEAAPGNLAATAERGDPRATEEAFAAADRVVEVDLVNNRLLPTALEPRTALARVRDATGGLVVEMATQKPHDHRADLARTLGLAERSVRVVSPSVGGGFGHKGHRYPGEAVTAWAALQIDRPVKWTATRSENALAGAHGRDLRTHAELAVDDDGRIRGVRVEIDGNSGAYSLQSGAIRPTKHVRLVTGQYHIPAAHVAVRCVFTNTAPIHSYRGAGRPEAIHVVERLVDVAADELGIDPAELRRRNLVPADDFPYETATGLVYDSGDYARALDVALETVGYDALRDRQSAGPDGGRLLGVGLAGFVEPTGTGYQSGVVRVHPSGDVTVLAGGHSHGQGHATTYAQVAADGLGIDPDDIDVVIGDTDRVPTGSGTSGSRSAVTGGNAVARSAERVAEKARRIAAHHLELAEADLVFDHGEFRAAGAPERSMTFAEVAAAAYGGSIPDGMEPGLEATSFYRAEGTAYSFGTHAAVVEVDPETGAVDLVDYVAVDDCGERLNPMLVDGQVHGGVAQGIGQARSEHAVYGDNGTLQTASLLDYAVPRPMHVPDIVTEETVTPSPRNPLGVKGVGEAGSIAAPPAVVNAVVDALAPFGVGHLDMPVTDETVWLAIDAAD